MNSFLCALLAAAVFVTAANVNRVVYATLPFPVPHACSFSVMACVAGCLSCPDKGSMIHARCLQGVTADLDFSCLACWTRSEVCSLLVVAGG